MALAAFNVFDYDTIRAVADAAGAVGERCYVQFSSSTVKYYGADRLHALFASAVGDNRDRVILHLDHCTDFELIGACIAAGWDSVMGDFSHLSLGENIENMLRVRELIGDHGVAVEGELGQVAGVEDGAGQDQGTSVNLEEVSRFVDATGVDLLAVGIGNAHGFYQSTEGIDIDLLERVHAVVPNQKLVLHGGTGIEPEKIARMKQLGIEKINISTVLKERYLQAGIEHVDSAGKYDMVGLVEHRYEAVKTLAMAKIAEFK